jgi:hypothetical protein
VATGRLGERLNDGRLVLAIGAATGIGLAWEGLRPTGQSVLDWSLLVLACAAAVWAAATAPWWALVVLAAVAAALAPPVAGLVVGMGVLVVALVSGTMRDGQVVAQAFVAGAAILVLAVARDVVAWGVNAAIAVGVTAAVGALGVVRRSPRERRTAWWALGGVAVVVLVAGLGLTVAGLSARSDLSAGNADTREALRLLKRGDFDAARESLSRAAIRFEQAADALDAPWAQPARLVPVVAQHRNAGSRLSSSVADVSRTIDEQLSRVDLDALRIVDGRIDIDAVRALQEPMRELRTALDVLDADLRAVDSGWLLPPVRDELIEVSGEIDEQQALGETAREALEVAPAMLGADEPRVYFVMFTTPAEARGQGGFMGNWAELTVTDGRIEMSRFGRHGELDDGGSRPRVLTTMPEDWMDRYGQFGFQKEPGGVVGEQPWQLNTLSPNFPSAAQLVADLYPQSGGRPVDGVFSLDVFAMQELIGLVGPLEIENAPSLTSSNTAEFLLLQQYEGLDDDLTHLDRIDMLETIARETITRLLTTNPPDPLELGRAMAPMVDASRVYAWSRVPEEQALLTDIGLDGTILDDDLLVDAEGARRDGVLVAVNNSGGSKIDSFLERSFTYDAESGELRLTFTNTAQDDGYPLYVIGTVRGEVPPGTSLLWLSVFTTKPFDWVSVDGQRTPVTSGAEAGKLVYDLNLVIGPRDSETVVFHFDPAQAYPPVLVEQIQPLSREPETSGFVR